MSPAKPLQEAASQTASSPNVETGKKEFDFPGHSSEGGRITVLYQEGKIEQVKVSLLSERGRVEFEFRQNPDGSVSVMQTSSQYDKSIFEGKVGDVKIVKTLQQAYILENGKDYPVVDGVKQQAEGASITNLYGEVLKIVDSSAATTGK